MLRLLVALFLASACLAADPPSWIWAKEAKEGELRHFRRVFPVASRIRNASLSLACDDQAVVSINGQPVGRNDDWKTPSTWNVAKSLRLGDNELTILARNVAGNAGLIARLAISFSDGSQQVILSDATWETSSDGSTGWTAATVLGKHGAPPWGIVFKPKEATPATQITVAPGFAVERLLSAQEGEGSWVAMAFDPKGRLILSPQGGEPLQRLSFEGGKPGAIEPLHTPVYGAMGLLWAFDSLYVNGRGPEGLAIYRLRTTPGGDQLGEAKAVRKWTGDGGEHGPHGMAAGPDGRLYAVSGNFVDVPPDVLPSSPVRNYADDLALPRLEDGNGFGKGRKPPGGFILRMEPDGSSPELFAAGQRNAYDIVFNDEGALFTFDSDMEWDWGMPWYRPIRILHCHQGADHGFREGSAKWPEWFPDSMPPVANVGIGSPTGITTGKGARFPKRYQQAVFAMDWSYGRIIAVHLRHAGRSYQGEVEEWLRGKPLNVTDLAVGPDGALYFITGGRGTQSGLYRVTYTGTEDTTPAAGASDPEFAARGALLREVEAAQREVVPGVVDRLWPMLGGEDRALRFSARVALERQPVDGWRGKALSEADARAGLTALLALARVGTAADQEALLKALAKWPLDTLGQELFLAKLRVIEVAFARHGVPEGELRKLALQKLGRQFPSKSWEVNRQLSALLVALDSPDVVSRALDLRDAAATQQEAVHYQTVLRKARSGWTPELRRRYFTWFHQRPPAAYPADFTRGFTDVGLKPANGASFDGYLKTIRQEAVAGLTDSEKGELAPWITGMALAKPSSAPTGPESRKARSFVRHWRMQDLEKRVSATGADVARGKAVYLEAQCAVCHRLNGSGGAIGPDLTGVGAKYGAVDLLRSLLEPSAIVSEQYQNTLITLNDGDSFAGRVQEDSAARVTVLVDPLSSTLRTVNPKDIRSRGVSPVSPMPDALLDGFTADEIVDLVAYLKSSGR